MIEEAHNEDMAELYAGLAKAKGEFPEIPKNRVATVKMKSGGSYSYKYADLADVFNAVTPVLSKHSLGVIQPDVTKDLVTTLIFHSSGATISGTHPIFARQDDKMHPAQAFQAAETMAKRYALTSMLGIATEESIEGDHSHKRNKHSDDLKDVFSNGMDQAWADGIKDSLPEDATPRQAAEAFSEAILTEMRGSKTAEKLNRIWNKRLAYIDAFAERQNDLYQNIFDEFHSLLDATNEDKS